MAMPELARLLGAPIVLQASTTWMLVSGILFLLTASIAWLIGSPKGIHLYIVALFSVPVGLLLGYRAKRLKLKLELDGAQPLRTAVGVAWRVGALWIVVSAIAEYLTESTTSSTLSDSPGILGLSIVAVGSSFLVAYGASAAVIAIRGRGGVPLERSQILSLLIGTFGLIVGILGLLQDAGSGVEEKTVAEGQIATLGRVARQDVCLSDQILAGDEFSCVLGVNDNRLPDGTYYREFKYEGKKDEQITISMTTEEFDAYLILGTGDVLNGSFVPLVENDDGGIGLGTDSRLSYILLEDRTYTVVANTLRTGETGYFDLRIERTE